MTEIKNKLVKKVGTLVKRPLKKKIVEPIPEPKAPTWEERVAAAWKIVKAAHPTWTKPDLVACTAILPFKSTEGGYESRRAYPCPQSMHCGIGYIYSWTGSNGYSGGKTPYTELARALFLVWCDYMRYVCPYGLIYTTTADHQDEACKLLESVGWVKSPQGSNHTHDYHMATIWTWVNHPVARDPLYKVVPNYSEAK